MPEIHPEHHYDKDGYIKPPTSFYVAILYLLRGYFILIMASSLGAKTQIILSVFYPKSIFIYVHLLVGLPAVLAWIILSYRETLRAKGRGHYLKAVKPLLLIGLVIDFVIHIVIASLMHWSFHWPVALGVVVPIYVVLFLVRKSV